METIESLKEKVTGLETQLKVSEATKDQALKDLEAAKGVIADLEARQAELEAGKPKLPVFTYAKEQYELESSFMWKGQEVTVDVLKENTKLVKELLEEKVSLIRKVSA